MRARRERAQDGVIAITVAILVVLVVLPLAALAVDIGIQRIARRDVQAVADTTAVDMARLLASGTTPDDTAAATSAARSLGTLGTTPVVHVVLGYVDKSATFISNQGLGCGGSSPYDSWFAPTDLNHPANAVLVTATTQVTYAMSGGKSGACRSAIGMAHPTGCYSVRSYLLSLSANATALNGYLNESFGVTAISYQNLVNSNVSLNQLAAQVGAGSVSQLANGTFSLGSLISGMAQIMSNQGNSSGALALRNLVSAMTAAKAATSINMGQLLAIGTGNGSVADASINALNLIGGFAAIADGSAFIDIPGITVSVPNLANVHVKLRVIQPPVTACNGAAATTGQVQLQVTGQLSTLSSGLVTISGGQLTVTASMATATAVSTGTVCVGSTPASMQIQVSNVSAANIAVDYSGLNVSVLGLLGLTSMARLSTTIGEPSTTGTYNLPLPQYYDPNYMSTGQPINLIPSLTAPNWSILGLSLLTGQTASDLMNPVLSALNTQLTSVIDPSIGVQIPGADIAAEPTPNCATPALAG